METSISKEKESLWKICIYLFSRQHLLGNQNPRKQSMKEKSSNSLEIRTIYLPLEGVTFIQSPFVYLWKE
jgi:hypothetical protein